MAIQIWDAQAGQYKSADIARFGGSGTLKEALVWDGTKYVKVWPSSPYPMTGNWEMGLTPGARIEVAAHTIAEGGSYSLKLSSSSAANTHYIYKNGGRVSFGTTNPWEAVIACVAGDVISFRVLVTTSGNYTGTYSITKI